MKHRRLARLHGSLALMSFGVSCMLFNPLDPAETTSEGGRSNSGGSQSVAGGMSPLTGGTPTDTMSGGMPSAAAGVAGEGGFGNESGGSAGAGGASTSCTTNLDCNLDASTPALCLLPEQRCVPLESPTCRVLGNPSDPRTLFFGGFAPFGGTLEGQTIRDTYDLALDEFMQLQGLPTTTGRRPLVMVLCDNEAGPSAIDEAVQHLTQDLRVPAILAALESADLQRNFERPYGAHTFYLSPQKVSAEFAMSDPEGLVWSLLGRSSDLAAIYAAVLRQFEVFWRKANPDLSVMRVAVVTQLADSDANELWLAVRPALRFNGDRSFDDNRTAANAIVVDDFNSELITNVTNFEPHLVISFVKENFTRSGGVAQEVEKNQQDRPYYLLSPWNGADLAGLRAIFAADERVGLVDPQQRFFGIDGPSALDPGSLQVRNDYQSTLLSKHSRDLKNFENFYDAFYYLVYAMHAGGSPVTSLGTARGMKRLYEGTDVCYTGPSTISANLNKLLGRDSIYLMGAIGAPTFDATGGRVDTGSVYCIDNLLTLRASVLGYDKATDKLFGRTPVLPCLQGFL